MPVFSWILNLAYLGLLAAVSPILAYRMLMHRKYREGWAEKLLGQLPIRESARPSVWFHAVSVGEVLLLERVVSALTAERPDLEIVISTTTSTGRAVARSKFPDHTICYFPLDFSWSVRRAIRRVRPSAIVLVELELWPNFILQSKRAGIPLALINARISEHSFRGYRRIRFLMRKLLGCFDVLAVQNETYSKRLLMLEAPRLRLKVTGSIKFDQVESDRANPKTAELRRSFAIRDDETVFIAGSTQSPEEEIVLVTYLELRQKFPRLRLILVPRHKERFEEVAQLVLRNDALLLRRTETENSTVTDASGPHRPVMLLDTLGELAACWGLADIAFVGGSLTDRGGQNMIEPAGYGAALLFGPNTHNFRDVVDLLLKGDAARVVDDGSELTAAVAEFLCHPGEARLRGQRARQLVLTQQGATAKTVQAITQILPAAAADTIERLSRAA